ncbi:hypothetical protein BN2497_12905 [Janthinobacterium sp. CG23_2]|nr:hypothetical protein BN2497_12905 [Janthinobacterium sp. CG23_2]CUU32850.1 hypothetical protein BN3177_12905 [Janthinobacterium sp. CG23_2]
MRAALRVFPERKIAHRTSLPQTAARTRPRHHGAAIAQHPRATSRPALDAYQALPQGAADALSP